MRRARPGTRKISARRALRLGRDERGVSVVEFGLILPIMGFMLIGAIDIGMGFARKFQIEQAAQRTIEMAGVGVVGSDYQFLRPEAAQAAKVPLANTTVDTWLECDRVRQPNFDGECQESQMVSRYVQIEVRASYTPKFSWGPLGRKAGLDANGAIPMVASAALRVQ